MSDLSQQNNDSTVIAGNKNLCLNRDSINKSQGRISASASRKNHSLSPVRQKKILEVRQQLVEGTYNIDKRLNTVLDRFIEDILV